VFFFTVRLERAAGHADRPTPPAATVDLPTLRILLAEDNPVNQRLAQLMLEKAGHVVVIASNGAEAVEHVRNEAFDIVLMDIHMPVMDGLEATRAIRKQEQQSGKKVPIVALTAYAMTGDRERFLREGMDGYVSKPIRPAELFECLRSQIDVRSS
jgi:CheY-like chemotaxis protein